MVQQVVFRICGAPLDDKTLSHPFAKGGYEPLAYKVYNQRTMNRLAPVAAVCGQDIVVIKIVDGPMLVLHPEHARDLLQSARVPVRGNPGDVAVTAALPWTSARNGAPQRRHVPAADAAIDWFMLLQPKNTEADSGAVADIVRQLEGSRAHALRHLSLDVPPGADDLPFDPATFGDGAPPSLLVFLHGTLIGTADTFGALWQVRRQELAQVFDHYGAERVLAFEHPTLSVGPIANALALVERLPARCVLDLVTHARGGLVAEVLVRALRDDDTRATAEHIETADPADAASLQQLRAALRAKSIVVRRMVRVACPARGTLLASRRLDAWLSLFHWLTQFSGLAIGDQVLELACAVARARPDLAQLPGLEAMTPDSAVVRWLNAPLAKVDSELYVIAGDSMGEGMLTWLQALAADALLWTDNDLIVQTRSMFGGVPRSVGRTVPRFMPAHDDRIDHFSYFGRKDTVQAMVDALCGRAGKAWQPIGPRAWDSGAPRPRASDADNGARDAAKPWVLVVPDLFGSVLTAPDGRKLWLNDRSANGLERLSLAPGRQMDPQAAVVPARLRRAAYGELVEHLRRTHHVLPFPYDWRLSLQHNAEQLGRLVASTLSSGALGEQPLRILAHGAGGLAVRAWHARDPVGWDQLTRRAGFRLLLLGVPNAGTWLPLRLLSGDETFGTLFGAVRPVDQEAELRELFAAMPGIVQLQAGLADPVLALHRTTGWEALEGHEHSGWRNDDRWHGLQRNGTRRQLDRWAIPQAALLDDAAALWQQLELALPRLLRDSASLAVVAGSGYRTVAGIEASARELYLLAGSDGDREVPLDSAALPGMPLWIVPAAHDALARTPACFDALTELLAGGSTKGLERVSRRAERGAELRQGPPLTRRLPRHGGLAAAGNVDQDAEDGRVTVRVHHGDLRFIRTPLLVGHYESMTLTGSEAVIDPLVGQRMSKALRAGVYPARTGSFQIFENGRHSGAGRRKQRYIPRPRAVVVVGLGEEGKLSTQYLAYTVRTGVLAYAERMTENHELLPNFELAATLVGSGGTGVTVSMAAVALAQGVLDANVRLREAGWPVVGTLTIVEVYLDRANDAWRVLRMQAESMPELHVDGFLRQGEGNLRRPLDTSYRGAAYDFISAVVAPQSSGTTPVIAYSLDTRRARTEVRAQRAQGPLVRDLVRRISSQTRPDRQIGRTLFNLLIPFEIEPYLTGSTAMLMELDGTTAALPWELLDTDPLLPVAQRSSMPPWAIRCKVLRKLRVSEYREQVADAKAEDRMLVIGDPLTTDPRLPPLDGARTEAVAIAAVARTAFGNHQDWVTELTSRPDATTIINALFASNYRIVHIAGHGTDARQVEGSGGVVLSGTATYLGADEINAMRITPELVFLNCCHLGQGLAEADHDRVAFAAGVAGALIGIGVRCVIAAGWAIEDAPAKAFAEGFYRELFAGRRFIDAVGAARQAAYEVQPDSNTWAAYQCYGDPDWSWKTAGGSVQPAPQDEYEGVASPTTLKLVLQAIANELLYSTQDTGTRNRVRLAWLQDRFQAWLAQGDVAQEFAAAYAALPDRRQALAWYERATRATDGSAALSAVEMYAEQLSLPDASIDQLDKAIGIFRQMCCHHGPTLKRSSLLGNAYRRRAVLADADAADLDWARHAYLEAAAIEPESERRHYPLRAAVACKVRALLLDALECADDAPAETLVPLGQLEGIERELAETLREIHRAVRENPHFWPIVAQTEFELLKGIVRENLAIRHLDISASLRDLHNRISTPRYWVYVFDDAQVLLVPYQRWMAARPGGSAEVAACTALMAQLTAYRDNRHWSPDATGHGPA